MQVSQAQTAPEDLRADALAVPVAGGEPLSGLAVDLDRALGGALQEAVTLGEHRGRLNEILPVHTAGRIAARRVLLYGLGSLKDLDGQRLRFAHHELARAARTYGHRSLGLVRGAGLGEDALSGVVEGCVMGSWERRSRQTGPPDRATMNELLVLGYGENRERDLVVAQQIGEAVNQARSWQDAPANELTPTRLAEEAQKIATRHGMDFEVLGPAELEAGGYRLLLGVASGSAQQPRLFRLHHRGAPTGAKGTLALVGKGITFDAGGLSIKTDSGMKTMKGDMAGAAAVLAAMDCIGARRIPADVMCVVASTENMLGAAAQRPGDVVTSANGKTVEILNTDAEGRLVLADAITYAIRHGAGPIIDLATLTGAATVAIGHAATAAIANDDDFWKLTNEAGQLAGERVWRLPNYPDYRVLLASRVADLRNSYYGEAGTITGGMFIQQFVEDHPWVHLDIAASTWNSNDELTSVPRGPLGAGTRLCIRLAELSAGRSR